MHKMCKAHKLIWCFMVPGALEDGHGKWSRRKTCLTTYNRYIALYSSLFWFFFLQALLYQEMASCFCEERLKYSYRFRKMNFRLLQKRNTSGVCMQAIISEIGVARWNEGPTHKSWKIQLHICQHWDKRCTKCTHEYFIRHTVNLDTHKYIWYGLYLWSVLS